MSMSKFWQERFSIHTGNCIDSDGRRTVESDIGDAFPIFHFREAKGLKFFPYLGRVFV